MKPKLHILHLEDNANDAMLISGLLHQQGIVCEMERVQTRESFLAALERGECDVILSDFTLPGFNGLAALALAREKRPDVPFLFISGTLGEEVAVDSLKLGAVDYVLKDRPSRLGAAVRRAMEVAEERQALQRAEAAMDSNPFLSSNTGNCVECLTEAAMVADAATGRVLDANKQAETLLGRTRGELIGLNQDQFLPAATLEEFRRRFGDAGSQAARVELASEVRSKAGRTIPVTVSAGPLILYGRRLILGLYRERAETK